ncbi:MAG: RsmD family RNA methyltransferase, partial [Planctomycetes bacterium]|nr:RsmD family RNA methyltransferase [Planctomycetota bacterium]
ILRVSLRIIGGEYRGRVLRTRRGNDTRPLLGQVREAVFNILTGRIEGAEVWDLFAGSGASGIEALSRGAARVLFVEKSNQALHALRENLGLLGASAKERSHVLRVDAWEPPPFRPRGEATEVPPDVVFFDPPYPAVAEDPVRAVCRARAIVDRLADGGVMCFHFREGHLHPDDFDRDLDVEMRSWGTTVFAFLSRRA